MNLIIKGDVSGKMLLGAILRDNYYTQGGYGERTDKGTGILKSYLGANTVRESNWAKVSVYSPEVAVARASLNRDWFDNAGQYIEGVTGVRERRAMLKKTLSPHLIVRSSVHEQPISNSVSIKNMVISAPSVGEIFEYKFPDPELQLISIPAGSFQMGSTIYEHEKPIHEVHLSEFSIGKYAITNGQYAIFLSQVGHRHPKYWGDSHYGVKKLNFPVFGVTWNDALKFSQWLGMRLPTEAEWEYAARGKESLTYPWGNEYEKDRAHFNATDTIPVTCYRLGVSPFGVWGMSGNVWEWVADWYGPYKQKSPIVDPKGPNRGTDKVLRGGAWKSDHPHYLRGAFRQYSNPHDNQYVFGFRVAEDVKR